MRVTQNMMNKQYLRNTNNVLSSKLKSLNRIQRQKAYTRVSEDSINASKALSTRRQLANIEMYNANLNTSKEIFNAAETNLYSISSKNYEDINTRLLAACNGTYSDYDRGIFADELEHLGNFIVDTMNSDFAERQLFGGTSNGATPFTIQDSCIVKDSGGNVVFPKNYDPANPSTRKIVCYNGVPVDLNAADLPGDGDYSITSVKDGATTTKDIFLNVENAVLHNNNALLFPGSDPIYVDVGMGVKYDENYNVDPQTVMDISLNGAQMIGSGVNYNGLSKNFAQLVLDTAEALRQDNVSFANHAIDGLSNCHSTVLTNITKLGALQNSIDFYLEKNDDYELNLQERQNNVEGVDIYEEITNYDAMDAAYNASLSLSSKVLPKSIFDFI